MHRLGGFVAIVEGDNLAQVYARLTEQVAVMLARSAGHALRRRRKTGTYRDTSNTCFWRGCCLDLGTMSTLILSVCSRCL